jgi:hypothetical protein
MNTVFFTFIITAASNAPYAKAFVLSRPPLSVLAENAATFTSNTWLYAKKPGNKKAKGFGKTSSSSQSSTIDIVGKSYGQTIDDQTPEEAERAMNAFFTQHKDYHPLFRQVMADTNTISAAALHHLNQQETAHDSHIIIDTWTSSDYPWTILPPKPSTNASLDTLSSFLDAWQTSLVEIPMDAFKNVKGGYDLHFLEEGRRTIAVTRFHVANDDIVDDSSGVMDTVVESVGGWKDRLFQLAWSEIGYYYRNSNNHDYDSNEDTVAAANENHQDTGSLILLPQGLFLQDDNNDQDGQQSHLDQVQQFVLEKLFRPMKWLGRSDDWEIVALERGTVGVRLLYRLGEIPDLSEKYQMKS